MINPDINMDNPFTKTVSACTYYRENCVEEKFFLLVYLLNEDKMPPYPIAGEYGWEMVPEILTMGDGPKKAIEMWTSPSYHVDKTRITRV